MSNIRDFLGFAKLTIKVRVGGFCLGSEGQGSEVMWHYDGYGGQGQLGD